MEQRSEQAIGDSSSRVEQGATSPTSGNPAAPEPSTVQAKALTDKQIQDAVFALLRKWNDDRAWDRYTRDSGPYEVTSLRPEVLEIIRAVLAAHRQGGCSMSAAPQSRVKQGETRHTRDDGGPAFPVEERNADGSPAWPSVGRTLRDYFAAKAMAALITGCVARGVEWDDKSATSVAYETADAMIKARQA